MTRKSIKMLNELRALVSAGNVPLVNPGEEATVTCCGPVEWVDVTTLRTVARMGKCSVCGAPVAMVRKIA